MSLTWKQLGINLLAKAISRNIPISGTFELTPRCNMKCQMCYVCCTASDRQTIAAERSTKDWIQLAHECRDAGMLYLLLTGGEIFIRHDFKEIYEEISKMGFNLTLYTNATMITPEIAKWLGRIPPSKIGVTIYGSSTDTYSKVCGYADGFQRAVQGIDLLLAEGISLQLRTTLIKDNVDSLDELAEFAEKRNVDFVINNYVSPRREGYGTSPEDVRLSPRELALLEFHVDKTLKSKSKNFKATDEFQSDIYSVEDDGFISKGNTVINPYSDSAFNCTAGKCAFWVTWDGRMIPCGSVDKPASSPFDTNFTTAWKELQESCNSIPLCKECTQCIYKNQCMTCPAKLKNETGFFTKPAPYLCELISNREIVKELLKI